MNSFSTFLLILIVLLLGIGGYFYLDQIIPMQTELKEVGQKNHELLFKVETLKSKNKELGVQLEKVEIKTAASRLCSYRNSFN